jgi:AbrB family looped-hinge helix DNA binding protein
MRTHPAVRGLQNHNILCKIVALYVPKRPTMGLQKPMPLVKVKQKGQMTIPAEIRDRLQLQQGDLLEATTDGRSVILTPKALVDREAASKEARESTGAGG